MKFVISTIILLYLLFQARIDIKTKQVYVFLNNIALILTIALYTYDCILYISSPPMPILATLLFITIPCLFNFYGIGDAKAIIVIFFVLRYWASTYPHPDITSLLIFLFITNLLFISFYKIRQIIDKCAKKERKYEREAFFPFLTIGYVLTIPITKFFF